MSTMVNVQRRMWVPVVAGAVTVALALVLLGLLAVPTGNPSEAGKVPPVAIGPDGEALPQADWKVNVFPTGVGKPTKGQRVAVSQQRDKLRTVVADVFDALILRKNTARLKSLATPGAAKALGRSELQLPKDMTEVETIRRSARVGVDEKATHAAARILITFKGMLNDKPVRMQQRSTLWLQKSGAGWRVIAFSGTMGRLR
jgi:hypothetical protein